MPTMCKMGCYVNIGIGAGEGVSVLRSRGEVRAGDEPALYDAIITGSCDFGFG